MCAGVFSFWGSGTDSIGRKFPYSILREVHSAHREVNSVSSLTSLNLNRVRNLFYIFIGSYMTWSLLKITYLTFGELFRSGRMRRVDDVLAIDWLNK